MKDIFQIYIDRLKESELIIDANAQLDFKIDEKELKMNSKVQISGNAYISENFLVVSLFAKTQYQKPCIICNEFATLDLVVEDFFLTVPLSEIKDKVYNFSEELRISLLLKIPHFIECNEGSCLQRKNLEKYLKKSKENPNDYFPFETLNK